MSKLQSRCLLGIFGVISLPLIPFTVAIFPITILAIPLLLKVKKKKDGK